MNILFLTIAYPDKAERSLYSDLMQEFQRRGHDVYVVCSLERRAGKKTALADENGVKVLRQRTLNLTKTNLIEKGLATLLIEQQFITAIRKHFADVKFDLLLYSTPPITFGRVVRFVKQRDQAYAYLLLKDIFPQNAVDLGMMKRGALIWRYFRYKEQQLYALSDAIGCMSKANVEYVKRHNPHIAADKVEECPNSINPVDLACDGDLAGTMRKKYGIPGDAVVFLFGGNLGKPQGLDFLLTVIKAINGRPDVFFLLVGAGTEYGRLERFIKTQALSNTRLFASLPKADYDNLVCACDVGLIFLHPAFTIPNFPSRLTAYMEAALPTLAATDVHTDLKDVLSEAECGLWAQNGDLDTFMRHLDLLAADPALRNKMGLAGRRYLEQHYTVQRSYDIIMRRLKKAKPD